MDWPEITKDTPLEEIKRIHQKIWQYVVENGEKPYDTGYDFDCVLCEYDFIISGGCECEARKERSRRMMEILFRGKRPSNDKWAYGFFWKDTAYCYILNGITDYIVNPETVGQYTSWNDKYGKKIFEGDIVKSDMLYCGVVVFEDGHFGVKVKGKNDLIDILESDEAVVIGNVHDNPELLENSQNFS